MSDQRQCLRCKHSCGPDSFVGKNGQLIKTCSSCRNVATHNTAGIWPACPIATNSMRSCSRSPGIVNRSSSTPAARSHQSSFSSATETVRAGPTFAPASSVIALGAQVDSINSRIGRLEDTIHLNFATILTHIDSLQFSPHPPSTPTSPAAITSQPPLPVFPWVPPEVISQVASDTLKPEHLILLHNTESCISKETPAQAGLVFTDGQVRIAKESSEQHSLSFAKVIPNICVLAQVWLIYTAICVHHTRDLDLNDALLAYLEILIKFDQIYLWKGVTEYHLAICHQHFATPSSSAPSSKPGAKSSHPSCTTTNPPPVEICLTFVPTATKNILSNHAALAVGSSRPTPTPPRRVLNDNIPCQHVAHTTLNRALLVDRAMSPTTTGSGPAVMLLSAFSPPGSGLVDMLLPASSFSGPSLADMLRPASSSLGSGLTGRMFPVASLGSGLVDWKLSATLPGTSCAPSASSAMLVPSLDFFVPQGITDMSSDSASTLLVSLLTGPVPPACPNTACELPIFDHSNTPATVGSLKLEHWAPFLDLYPDQDFANQLRVGVVPKPHSDKCCTIYHLSHPRQLGACLPSVNDSIHHLFVSIHYETLNTIIDFVHRHQGASLWKLDLEDAFQHVIMAEGDARLMGFHFDRLYYQEYTLAFSSHLSPFLFNLFTKFLHWVMSFALQSASPSPTSHSEVYHYLDDFFGTSHPVFNASTPIQVLSVAVAVLCFRLSCKKTVWSTTRLEILGIKLDSVAQTASITDQCHQHILQLCQCIVIWDHASLLELQQVTGHLQFVTRVAPHSLKSHHQAPFGCHISRATRDKLMWWTSTLHGWDGMFLLQPSPLIVEHMWMDASKHSIGSHCGHMEHPTTIFSSELSQHHFQRDICFLEALAVLEVLRLFSSAWSGPHRVLLYVDNENFKHGLQKGSICNPMTQVLFREIFALCLQRHIDLQVTCVHSKANTLTDTFSHRCFALIQQEYPQAFSLLRFNGGAASQHHPAALLPPPSCLNERLSSSGMASRSTKICSEFATFVSTTFCSPQPFPATVSALIEWAAHYHEHAKTYHAVSPTSIHITSCPIGCFAEFCVSIMVYAFTCQLELSRARGLLFLSKKAQLHTHVLSSSPPS
ncbi:uncharacterized protein UBRO_20596 [Ustilago bromivora]|uniref:Reverse transcriptase domain-containing protein n=1 Tax=Ustilago bromivora TaxID=307758 RepID=A0A1K0G229_9BASI|nr:uncharacterized protein UBRO_20596 [Ustilago bromivora]